MQGAHTQGLFTQGNYEAIRQFDFLIAEGFSEGIRSGARATMAVGDAHLEGVMMDPLLIAFFTVAEGKGQGERIGARISGLASDVSVEGVKVGARLSQKVSELQAEGVKIEDFVYYFVPKVASASAEGVKLHGMAVLKSSQAHAEGVTMDPRYDVSGVPEFIANRINNDTLELEVENLDSRNIRVEKKPDEISTWAELATYTPAQFNVTVDISADPNPKLKAAFTVTGTIGGVTVNPKGRFSITNSIRKDG